MSEKEFIQMVNELLQVTFNSIEKMLYGGNVSWERLTALFSDVFLLGRVKFSFIN